MGNYIYFVLIPLCELLWVPVEPRIDKLAQLLIIKQFKVYYLFPVELATFFKAIQKCVFIAKHLYVRSTNWIKE